MIFLNFHSNPVVTIASAAVGRSIIERWAITTTEPVIAPTAAAVTPREKDEQKPSLGKGIGIYFELP